MYGSVEGGIIQYNAVSTMQYRKVRYVQYSIVHCTIDHNSNYDLITS